MATNPIAAGFTPANPDTNPWFDEVDAALHTYRHFAQIVREVPEDEMQALTRHAMLMGTIRHLSQLGVTVTGACGHA